MSINEISWNGEAEGFQDLLDAPALADFKDINSLAKAFIDTKAMVGQSIRVPSKEAGADDLKSFHDSLIAQVPGLLFKPDMDDDAAMNALFKSIGLPEDTKGYGDIDVGESLLTEEDIASMKEDALASGLTVKQFNSQMKKIIERSTRQSEDYDISHNKDTDLLQREWGEAYEMRVAQAGKIAEATNAPEDLIEAIKLGQAPASSIKWLYGLAERVGGEDFQIALQEPSGGGITPNEASERARELRNQLSDGTIIGDRRDSMIKKLIEYDKKAAA